MPDAFLVINFLVINAGSSSTKLALFAVVAERDPARPRSQLENTVRSKLNWSQADNGWEAGPAAIRSSYARTHLPKGRPPAREPAPPPPRYLFITNRTYKDASSAAAFRGVFNVRS